eukprot:g46655.t1
MGTPFAVMLLLLIATSVLLVPGITSTAPGQDSKATRFVCTSVPLDADPSCPVPAVPMPVNTAQEQELRATVMQLRETILQQKETLGNQKETIKELTSKLTRCESAQLDAKYMGSRRKQHVPGKDTMGDLPRDHSQVVDHLGRTIQALKNRLGSLEVRPTASITTPDRMVSPIRREGDSVRQSAGLPTQLGPGSSGTENEWSELSMVLNEPPKEDAVHVMVKEEMAKTLEGFTMIRR